MQNAAFHFPPGGPPEPGSLAHPATPVTVKGQQRRFGCMRMTVGSKHFLAATDDKGQPVTDRHGRPQTRLETAKDRRLFPLATGFYFCLHERCAGKAHASEADLLRAHPGEIDMQKKKEVHVVGFFSPDPLNGPEAGCKDCDRATKEATTAAKSETPIPRPCTKHSGGPIGLLTPGDPAVLG